MNEKKIEESKSVKKLLSKREYAPKTRKDYIKHIILSSEITGKTPDEMAKEGPKLRGIIIEELRKRGEKVINVYHHNSVMNLFWRANGWEIKDPYKYIPPHIRRDILRLKKLKESGNPKTKMKFEKTI
jgi:hypothetical protein